MASLATALTATKTEFSNELTYMPGMAPRSANCPALEHGGMQVTSLCFCQLDIIICVLILVHCGCGGMSIVYFLVNCSDVFL